MSELPDHAPAYLSKARGWPFNAITEALHGTPCNPGIDTDADSRAKRTRYLHARDLLLTEYLRVWNVSVVWRSVMLKILALSGLIRIPRRPHERTLRTQWLLGLSVALSLPAGCVDSTEPARLEAQIADESIGLGFFHSCGLTTSGAAYCWGGYEASDPGNGRQPKVQPTPTAIAGGLAFRQLSAGGRFTCGLTSSGAAWCWGLNDEGQLGDGTSEYRSIPVAVSGSHTSGRSAREHCTRAD